jgi:hypothetical protein
MATLGTWNIHTCLQMAVYDMNSGDAHFRHAQSLDKLIDELHIIHVLCRKMILHRLFLLQLVSKQCNSFHTKSVYSAKKKTRRRQRIST